MNIKIVRENSLHKKNYLEQAKQLVFEFAYNFQI